MEPVLRGNSRKKGRPAPLFIQRTSSRVWRRGIRALCAGENSRIEPGGLYRDTIHLLVLKQGLAYDHIERH